MPKLTRKHQVAGKIEAVEGVEEILAAADADVLAYDPRLRWSSLETFQRDPARASLSDLGELQGAPVGDLTFRVELKGSGDVTIPPSWGKWLQGAGHKQEVLSQVPIGAVTGGPFQHFEQVTNATGVSGTVRYSTPDGKARLIVTDVTGGAGSFADLDVLTGATSGATATASAAQSLAGFGWKPDSNNPVSLTVATYEDGFKKRGRGARGSVSVEFVNGQPAFLVFTYRAAAATTIIEDTALLSGVVYESTTIPLWFETGFVMGTYAPCVTACSLNFANEVTARGDAGAAPKGIKSFYIGGRNWTGSATIEAVPLTEFDAYGRWQSGLAESLEFAMATTPGEQIRVLLPRIPIQAPEDLDEGGLHKWRVPFSMSGTLINEDDESYIAML